MREIKFRGKRVDNGEWVHGWYVGYSNAMGYIYRDYVDKNEVWQVDAKTVGQYTGLKDKNSVEIYEGDIMQYEDYPPQKVRWDDCAFCVDDYLLTDWYDGTVVIGNIHDNAELMEVE